jgi:hypothetical protein
MGPTDPLYISNYTFNLLKHLYKIINKNDQAVKQGKDTVRGEAMYMQGVALATPNNIVFFI